MNGRDAVAGGPVRQRVSSMSWRASAAIGSALIVVLSLPQFLRLGSGPPNFPWYVDPDGHVVGGLIIDQIQFMRLADAFAGRAGEFVVSPFSSRALAPWLASWPASWLGLSAASALMLVNVGCLVVGTFALAALANDLTRKNAAVLVSVLVWSASFPVLWYTGKGLVDAAAVGVLPVVLLAAHRRRIVAGCVAFAVAIWMKEASVVLVVPLVAQEWMRSDRPPGRRVAFASAWLFTATVAFLSTGLLVPEPGITFAPWIPPAWATVREMLWNNLSGVGGLGQYLLAALPAAAALALWARWLRSRGRSPTTPGLMASTGVPAAVTVTEPTDRRAVVVPMLLAIVVVLALGLWSLWSALFDGRSVWMTVPFGALLVGIWLTDTAAADRRPDLRRAVRTVVVVYVVLAVVWVALGTVVTRVWSPVARDPVELTPRFASAPAGPVEPLQEQVQGSGTTALPAPDGGTFVVRFESSEPASIVTAAGTLPHAPVRSGTVLVDSADDAEGAEVEIRTEGDWSADISTVDAAMPWEFLSALEGNGPGVLLVPGGLLRPVRVDTTFADPSDRLLLAGRCALFDCPGPSDSDIIPAGTEAIVVDAVGDWQLVPQRLRDEEPVPDPI